MSCFFLSPQDRLEGLGVEVFSFCKDNIRRDRVTSGGVLFRRFWVTTVLGYDGDKPVSPVIVPSTFVGFQPLTTGVGWIVCLGVAVLILVRSFAKPKLYYLITCFALVVITLYTTFTLS